LVFKPLVIDGTFNYQNSLIKYTANYTENSGIVGITNTSYYNLEIDNSSETNNFTLTSGSFYQMESSMNIGGNFSLADGADFNKGVSGQTLTFDGTGSLTDNNTNKQDLGAVVIAGTNTTRTLATPIKMSSLTINSGNTFSLAGNNLFFSNK